MFKHYITDVDNIEYALEIVYKIEKMSYADAAYQTPSNTFYEVEWDCISVTPGPVTAVGCAEVTETLRNLGLMEKLCIDDYIAGEADE